MSLSPLSSPPPWCNSWNIVAGRLDQRGDDSNHSKDGALRLLHENTAGQNIDLVATGLVPVGDPIDLPAYVAAVCRHLPL